MKHDSPPTHGLLLRVLLNRTQSLAQDSILKNLPQEEVKNLKNLPIRSSDPTPLLASIEKPLSLIHYSWLYEWLKDVPLEERQLIISTLTDYQREGLARLFQEPLLKPISSDLLKQFILLKFECLFPLRSHLPLEYLPENALTSLLSLTKKDWVNVINLLSMYDLAHELRGIVSTKNIKAIYSALSPQQQQFLRQCIHQKDRVVSPKLQLDHWNGNPDELFKILQLRGLYRLAIALSGQHVDFIWYIIHILDRGRGQLLQSKVKNEEIPLVSTAVIHQLESVLHYYREGTKSE